MESHEDEEPLLASSDEIALESTPASGWTEEFWLLLRLTLPLAVNNIFGYIVGIVSIAFIGHISPLALASAVLATSIYNVTGLSVVMGLAAGMETLCGQAFGARRFQLIGLVMQRAMIVCLVTSAVIILGLWWNIEPILIFLHQDREVADGAGRYLRILSPSLLGSAVSSVLSRYLLAQRVASPSTFCTLASALVAPIYNYLLVFRYDLGMDGAAIANVLCVCTNAFLLSMFVIFRDLSMVGLEESTWPGLQLKAAVALKDLKTYMKYGIAAAAMICLEWWAFEVLVVTSGTTNDPEISVSSMGIAFNISGFFYMFSMGLGSSSNTRVANELGAGRAAGARLAYWVSFGISSVMQASFCTFLFFQRNNVVKIFSTDPQVVEMVDTITPVLCCAILGDGLNAVFMGALRGAGRQTLGAWMNLVGWWGVVVPLAFYLGVYKEMGTLGFWMSLALGTNAMGLFFFAVLLRMDWEGECLRARDLIHSSGQGEDAQLLDEREEDVAAVEVFPEKRASASSITTPLLTRVPSVKKK